VGRWPGVARFLLQTDRSVFDQIEKLKRDLTDKYVVVVAAVPELMRFDGHVGQVKTVNMNGRALVEFDAWNNIGWYDIELDYLKVVPKPEATAEAKQPEAKREAAPKAVPAAPVSGEKKLSPLEMARMQGAAKGGAAKPPGEKPAPAGGAKKSTAEILAAARAKAAPAAGEKPSPAPAAKMSTADILAAARAKKAAEAAAAPTAAPVEASSGEAESAQAAPAPAASTMAKPKPATSQTALTPGQRPGVSEILAWCREHDAK